MNPNRWLFILLALVVGCTAKPVAPATSQPGLIGLLEVKISGLSGNSPTAQTQWLGAGVSRQSVGLVETLPTVKTRVVQVIDSNLNYLGQPQDSRYVSAVLEVTNNAKTSFDNLIFYAINDPARSLGGTALSSLAASDGSPITDPTVAQAFVPTHGMYNSGWSVVVNPSHTHLHLLSLEDVRQVRSGLQSLGLPATVEPLQYGFRAPNAMGGSRRSVGAVGSGANQAFSAIAYTFPRSTERAKAPDSFTLLYAVGNDTTNSLTQSLEEQSRNTVAGLAFTNAAVSGVTEVRTLGGSTYSSPNQRPLCRIVTAGSIGQPLATLGTGDIGCVTLPVIPTGFTPGNLTAISANLSWKPVVIAESYTLERGLGSAPSSWTTLSNPATTSYTDPDLIPSTLYTYRLKANNSAGSSDWVSTTLTTPAAAPVAFDTENWVTGIGDIPWSINFTPDGKRLLYTPRNQPVLQIHSVDLATRQITPIVTNPPIAVRVGLGGYNEGGILGMELDPDFAHNNRVYICYSYWQDGIQQPENRFLRVSGLEIVGNALTNEHILIDKMDATDIHTGCRVVINDGYVYASTGDATLSSDSQSLSKLSGKILRVALDGTIPADNPDWDNDPTTRSPIWTLGHRNPQGLAFQPGTNLLWSTEHGPYTRDEINIIRPGRNYGWPRCIGEQAFGTTMVVPEWTSTQTFNCQAGESATLTAENYQPALKELEPERALAISDLLFYPATAKAFPDWRNSILFVTLRSGRMYHLEVDGQTIRKQEILLDYGENTRRMRDIAVGPDGLVYISTDEGEIFRLVPRQ